MNHLILSNIMVSSREKLTKTCLLVILRKMSVKDDYSWVIPGDDYPLMTGKYKKWKVRELHQFEAVEIAREILKRCLLEPKRTIQNINAIYDKDLFKLFSIVVDLTQKSHCFPHCKKLLGIPPVYEEKEESVKKLEEKYGIHNKLED